MDYLRRSARVSRLQKISNTAIRSKMQAEQSILNRIKRMQLNWYGHLLRMAEEVSHSVLYKIVYKRVAVAITSGGKVL